MKRRLIVLVFSLLFSSAVFAEELYIKVRSTKLRAQPKAWGSAVADLRYGDKLTVVDDGDAAWPRVKSAGGAQGYVSQSALSNRKIVISTNSNAITQADPSEVVVAGKGFGKSVEQQYAQASTEANFREVDRMERLKISDGEVLNFMRQGQLNIGGQG